MWLEERLVAACGIQFSDYPSPPPSHWEHRVPVTGPPGKSPRMIFKSRSAKGEGVNHVDIWIKAIQGEKRANAKALRWDA